MFPTHILQWRTGDSWVEIGWRADTSDSMVALKAHAEKMAAAGGRYRLVRLALSGEPFGVVQEWCDPPEYQPDEDSLGGAA